MTIITEKPSWADAPRWATHLMVRDIAIGKEYGWAELNGESIYIALPYIPEEQRVKYVVGKSGWNVVEARPVEPSFVLPEPARCGRCHFAGPVERGLCLCRRHSPVGMREPHIIDMPVLSIVPAFPIMAAKRDWCGDFIPAQTEGAQ